MTGLGCVGHALLLEYGFKNLFAGEVRPDQDDSGGGSPMTLVQHFQGHTREQLPCPIRLYAAEPRTTPRTQHPPTVGGVDPARREDG